MSKRRVCSLEDVPENGMRTFEAEGGLRVLIAHSGNDYFAYQPICPHQDVELEEGMYDGCVLTCHMHLWQWDIRTGAPMGLAEAPLIYYDVKVEEGSLFIVPPNALKMAELFDGVPESTLDKIITLARSESHEEGSTLYKVGDPVEDFYVLESGRVNFAIGREERTRPAGFMLRKGEVFGWAALLENQPQRIASATCLEKSSLLAINGKQTLQTLESDPAAGFIVMRRLSSLITRHLTASGAE
jgi:toluene monooxygenase system ferredoxin subunit